MPIRSSSAAQALPGQSSNRRTKHALGLDASRAWIGTSSSAEVDKKSVGEVVFRWIKGCFLVAFGSLRMLGVVENFGKIQLEMVIQCLLVLGLTDLIHRHVIMHHCFLASPGPGCISRCTPHVHIALRHSICLYKLDMFTEFRA